MTDINFEGTVVAEPELRYTQAGKPMASVRVAVNNRRLNKQTNQWEDQGTLWLSCAAFGHLAEGIAGAVHKGMLVCGSGSLTAREYTTNQGVSGVSNDVMLDHLGASFKFQQVVAQKNPPQQGGFGGQPTGFGQQQPSGFGQAQPQQQAAQQQGGFGQQGTQWSNQTTPSDPWGGQPAGQPDQPPF